MQHPANPTVPISWGELIDKITILDIKRARLSRPEALANVQKELALLSMIGAAALESEDVAQLFEALRRVNEELWDIEDAIRTEEANGRFGTAFVRLARSVYKRNDERAAIKRRINTVLASELTEEKSYADIAPVGREAHRRSRPRPFVERNKPNGALGNLKRGARAGIAIQREQPVETEPELLSD
jgi:hypothetical protein